MREVFKSSRNSKSLVKNLVSVKSRLCMWEILQFDVKVLRSKHPGRLRPANGITKLNKKRRRWELNP